MPQITSETGVPASACFNAYDRLFGLTRLLPGLPFLPVITQPENSHSNRMKIVSDVKPPTEKFQTLTIAEPSVPDAKSFPFFINKTLSAERIVSSR